MFLCIYNGIIGGIAGILPFVGNGKMKEVLLSICAASVITAIYKAIAPVGKFGTQIRLLTVCFFILTAVNAVSGLNDAWDLSDITVPDGSYNDYSVQVTQTVASETASVLRRTISEALAEENIFPEKIYIDVNIPDEDRISINEIRLVFDRKEYDLYADRAIVLVRRLTGTAINVTAELSPQTAVTGGSS